MSTNALNQVYKTGILAVEELKIFVTANAGAGSVQVSGYTMSNTPLVAGDNRPYVLIDQSFAVGANGLPNAERVCINSISGASATPNADGIGYLYSATLLVSGYSTSGWGGGLENTYSVANNPTILCPGVEMAIQSSDFNCRFKTLSDAPKIDFDDEASRFATGDEGRDLSIAGARSSEVNFTEKLAWAGAVTTVPTYAKLMRTMGFLVKKYSTTGIGFIPSIFANEITATIWVLGPENGAAPSNTVYRYVGAHGGNASSISVGKVSDPWMLTGKFNAAYIGTMEIPLTAARSLTSPETTTPEVMTNNTVSVPAYVNGVMTTKNVEISQFSLDFGGVVNPFTDQNTSTGYAFYVTSDRDIKLTINPYHVRKSLDDIDYVATQMKTGIIKITSTHMFIEVPNAQMLSPAQASREGYMNTNRTYRALRNNLGGGATEATMPDSAMCEIVIGARS
jgi:hypothetical protein